MNVELLDKALAEALCPTFQALVKGGSTISVLSLAAGPYSAPIQSVALPVTALSMLGASATCPEVEIGADAGPCEAIDGCKRVENGFGTLESTMAGWDYWLPQGVNNCTEIVSVSAVYQDGNLWARDLWLRTLDNPEPWLKVIRGQSELESQTSKFRINVTSGTCADSCSGAPEPNVPDTIYTDESTNCTYNVHFEGLIQEFTDGPVMPVYEIKSINQSTRASGGRMGGCYMDPVIVVGGPNGPGGPSGPPIPPIPVPPFPPGPEDGIPWWAKPLLAGATAAALNEIADALKDLLEPQLDAGSFTLVAPCDKDAEGKPLVQQWTYPKQKAQERMLAHQTTMLEALQTHLNWKTPICEPEKPCLEGDFRTISFRSDQTSPYGKSRLRKRFRYRSTSGLGLSEVVNHWAGFTFEAGPVCVIHSGSAWGTPQVWAATADEGKRVIRHAGGEAGIDPDQVGRWTVSGSDSARVGVSGTMTVDTTGGFYWITARDGSNSRPVVAKT